MSLLTRWLDLLFHRNPTPTPEPNPNPSPLDKTAFLAELNRARTQHGLTLLQEDLPLSRLSQSWSAFMADKNILTHGDTFARIAALYPNAPAGEIIAEGQATVTQVVQDWMNDLPHRQILLGNFNKAGLGYSVSQRNLPFWTVDFVLR